MFQLQRGLVPLLISLPHVGTEIPPDLAQRFVPRALLSEDTDWRRNDQTANKPEEKSRIWRGAHEQALVGGKRTRRIRHSSI